MIIPDMKKLLLTCSLFFSIAPNAFAGCGTPPLHENYRNADIVFTGKIVDGEGGDQCGSKRMLAEPDKFYKGLPSETVWIKSGDSCKGIGASLKKDVEYIIFATATNQAGEYDTDNCSGTRSLEGIHHAQNSNFGSPHYPGKDFWERLEKLSTTHEYFVNSNENFDEHDVLRLKAQHFIYWRDFQRAEVILKKLLDSAPDDWVINNYVLSLYEQKSPRKIVVFAEDYEHLQNNRGFSLSVFDRALGYGYLLSGEDPPTVEETIPIPSPEGGLKYSQKTVSKKETVYLKDTKINGVEISNRNLDKVDISDVEFWNTDFLHNHFTNFSVRSSKMLGFKILDSEYEKLRVLESSIWNGAIENTAARSATFKNTTFNEVTLENVKLENSTFDNVSLGAFKAQNSSFKNSVIKNSRIKSGDFSSSNLENLSLDGTSYSCRVKWPEYFDPAAAGGNQFDECAKKE